MPDASALDRTRRFVVRCPECHGEEVKLLRDWRDPLPKADAPAFNPTHQCTKCGFRWIYRSPKEKLRSFVDGG